MAPRAASGLPDHLATIIDGLEAQKASIRDDILRNTSGMVDALKLCTNASEQTHLLATVQSKNRRLEEDLERFTDQIVSLIHVYRRVKLMAQYSMTCVLLSSLHPPIRRGPHHISHLLRMSRLLHLHQPTLEDGRIYPAMPPVEDGRSIKNSTPDTLRTRTSSQNWTTPSSMAAKPRPKPRSR
jgi:hypothetical protein